MLPPPSTLTPAEEYRIGRFITHLTNAENDYLACLITFVKLPESLWHLIDSTHHNSIVVRAFSTIDSKGPTLVRTVSRLRQLKMQAYDLIDKGFLPAAMNTIEAAEELLKGLVRAVEELQDEMSSAVARFEEYFKQYSGEEKPELRMPGSEADGDRFEIMTKILSQWPGYQGGNFGGIESIVADFVKLGNGTPMPKER